MSLSCAATTQLPSTVPAWLPWSIFTAFTLLVLVLWWRNRPFAGLDVTHPLLLDAKRRAQSSLPKLRQLLATQAGHAEVRFAFISERGHMYWLWGDLDSLSDQDFHVTVRSDPGMAEMSLPFQATLPVEHLCDWRVQHDAQSPILGGHTTQAEIRLLRQARKRIPASLGALAARLADNPLAASTREPTETLAASREEGIRSVQANTSL